MATRRNCLSLREAAFDEVALGVEVRVERVLLGARWVVGDDGDRAFGGDGLAEMVGVIGGVGHDDLGWHALDQTGRPGARRLYGRR